MNIDTSPLIALNACPWSELTPAKMQFCEASRCALIAQPGNSWSNLAFFATALVLLRLSHAENRGKSLAFAAAAVSAGLGSFLYHASNTYLMELVDLGSMYGLSCLMLTLSLAHLRQWSKGRQIAAFSALLIASIITVCLSIDLGNGLFGAELGLAILMEVTSWRRQRHHYMRYLAAAGLLFIVAYGLWNIDYYKIICYPHSPWLNGHAAWHVLTAAALGFTGHYYNQRSKTKN